MAIAWSSVLYAGAGMFAMLGFWCDDYYQRGLTTSSTNVHNSDVSLILYT